ncbi:MAG: 1-acyl-sn-glycerol-3-phosphate acyltransferase [Planctomycetes bacterium]|nr:1-acyl-sn-glycerol-3-phosphate acyltransferase [Planctomycetota bacterium]
MRDPLPRRWLRRLVTTSCVSGLALALWALAPLWLLVLGSYDLLAGRRGASVRCLAVLTVFTTMSVLGLIAALAVWIACGRRHRRREALDYALQERWAKTLHRGLVWIYGIRLSERWSSGAPPAPDRRLLVLERHTSVADTLLPIQLLYPAFRLRYVMKRELLWDPCLDVIGQRLPNAFVERGAGERDVTLVADLARDLPPGAGVLIFPEGTRCTPARRAQVLGKLRERGDPRADYAARLRHLLPPRRGGVLALRQRAPDADVVVVGHTGYEKVRTLGDLWGGSLIGAQVSVCAWVHPAADVPRDPEACSAWLDARWLELDAWIDAQTRQREAVAAACG